MISKTYKHPVIATIGKFDVVHLGHVNIFNKMLELKAIPNLKNAELKVFIVYPNPVNVLRGQCLVKTLYNFCQRARIIKEFFASKGFKCSIVLQKFTKGFSHTTTEAFIYNLQTNFNVTHIVCGDNFKFGQGATGSTVNLAMAFEVFTIPADVSSGMVKFLIESGNIAKANELCAVPVFIEGIVQQGAKLAGAILGFATANIALKNNLTIPKYGVYKAKLYCDGKCFISVCNIGIKPTFAGVASSPTLEVHAINQKLNLYGKKIKVELLQFLRSEQKFDSPEALKNQIVRDINLALSF